MTELLSNFDIDFEEARARRLAEIDSIQEFQFRRNALVSYNKDQMIKGLGERFHVVLSTYDYDITNGQLWGKDMDEPAITSFERGRDHRLDHGNPVDFRREEAEVVGFRKIEATLADEDTPVGTTIMSVSQPGLEGTTYNDNFIDFHTKKRRDTGEFYVESQRVSSGLTMDETIEKLAAFATIEVDQEDPAASLLENPIAIENTMTVDDLKYYMYKDHDYMDQRTFNAIVKSVSHLVDAYAISIADRPEDRVHHRLIANTILNKADEMCTTIDIVGVDVIEKITPIPTDVNIESEIDQYGYNEVREVLAGCGNSGGFDVNGKDGPQSVADFGKKERILCCTCPFCKNEVEAVISGGRIKCPSCEKIARWKD